MAERRVPDIARVMHYTGDLLIVGPTGVGKSVHVHAQLVDRLTRRHRATILDCGHNYYHACQALGGSFTSLRDDGGHQELRFSDTPLQVFDFDEVTKPIADLEVASFGVNDLLIVDEVVMVGARFSGLLFLLQQHVAAGGNFCIVGQSLQCVEAFFGLRPNVTVMKLSRLPRMEPGR